MDNKKDTAYSAPHDKTNLHITLSGLVEGNQGIRESERFENLRVVQTFGESYPTHGKATSNHPAGYALAATVEGCVVPGWTLSHGGQMLKTKLMVEEMARNAEQKARARLAVVIAVGIVVLVVVMLWGGM